MATARDSPSSRVKRSRLQSQEAPSRLQLLDDRAARFRLPRPDALEERLAAHRPAVRLLGLGELALDDHLGRDSGVVGARLPKDVASVHAPVAAEDVLQRVVERVAHVQVAGDVRRRDDHAEGLRVRALRPAGPERARRLPQRGDARLDRGSVKRFVHHGMPVRAALPGRLITIESQRIETAGRRRRRCAARGFKPHGARQVNGARMSGGSGFSATRVVATGRRAISRKSVGKFSAI